MLNWQDIYSSQRTGKQKSQDHSRSAFQVDFDRLIFSSPFRRLQNKTQVFPLPGSIFVHNRLTHSLEVASVGRSLGTMVGNILAERHQSTFNNRSLEFYKYDLSSIISAACLAHDIGNPAFGHSGEDAIGNYFSKHAQSRINGQELKSYFSDEEWSDLIYFEGNANSIRILTQNLYGRLSGGYRMTHSTLAAIAKYPCESIARNKKFLHRKKIGFFQSEKSTFQEIASGTGMITEHDNPLVYKRHPFVYLVEAADDICYRIVDLEDAHRLKILSSQELKDLLLHLLEKNSEEKMDEIHSRLKNIGDVNERMSYLRAKSINFLVQQSVEVFLNSETEILSGNLENSLIDLLTDEIQTVIREIDQISINKIYRHRSVVELEIAGFHVLSGLLDILVPAVLTETPDHLQKNMLRLIPEQYMGPLIQNLSPYDKIFCAIDFVSGMTDIFAVELYKKIKGISIGLS